jgi:3-oxoacyl-[acyl-carrier-protein] synthase III
MFEIIKNVAIKSIISVVPKKKIKLKKSEKDKRILRVSRVIGVNQSYKADKNTTVVDLFEKASKEIIKKNFIKKNKIKFLICVTQTPDYLMPSCSNILHQKLSLDKDCIAFDINLGCSGYVYGLFVMMNLVFKSKNNFIGLLLVGDTISQTVNRQDKSNALLFGDGVSATLVKKKIDNKNFFLVGSGVEGFDKLLIKNSGFKLDKKQKMKPEFFMDGKEVFSFAVSTVPKMIDEIIQKSKIKKKTINFFILHQANKMMLDKILDITLIEKRKRLFSIKDYGNTSSASIPITICNNLSGKRKKKLCMLSGFGAGFSYATCITDITNTKIFKIIKKL